MTYLLVDGENIDATLGTSILGRRPRPEERPRWERLLQFAQEQWGQPAHGLFFLAANNELPMSLSRRSWRSATARSLCPVPQARRWSTLPSNGRSSSFATAKPT